MFKQHFRCLHSHHRRLFHRIDKHFIGDWMVIFCGMVNIILPSSLHKFPSQKCRWLKFRLFVVEYCRIHNVHHLQYWTVCHTRNSGRFEFETRMKTQKFKFWNLIAGRIFGTISSRTQPSSIERCIFCVPCHICHRHYILPMLCIRSKFAAAENS